MGGAIRAAQHGLNHSLKALEQTFCNKSLEVISPDKSNKEIYERASDQIKSMLLIL